MREENPCLKEPQTKKDRELFDGFQSIFKTKNPTPVVQHTIKPFDDDPFKKIPDPYCLVSLRK